MPDFSWLPELVEFDWNSYGESIERAYRVFLRDFGSSSARPKFQGRTLNLKRHPEYEGKSATFWHFVTEGKVEEARTPVRERVERIAWPRALIVEAANAPPRVCVWPNQRPGASKRWVLALMDFSYVVILDDRDEYLLPWTAYPVSHEHQRRKLRKEYEASVVKGRPRSGSG
jgi:hypothetical protein